MKTDDLKDNKLLGSFKEKLDYVDLNLFSKENCDFLKKMPIKLDKRSDVYLREGSKNAGN